MTRTGLFRVPVVAGAAIGLVAGLSGPPGTVIAGTTSHSTTTARAVSPRAHGVTSRLTGPHVIATPFVIGVDAPTPVGHNIEYRDYFPRAGLTVNSGDVIDFMWDPELSPDSFHTVTLLNPGTSLATDTANNPVAMPDEPGTGELPLFTPPGTFAPTDPSCGTSADPCTFDGSAPVSSGGTGPGSDFFVKVTASPGTYNFHCRVHPGMTGSFSVTTGAESTVAEIETAAAQQFTADSSAIMAAEATANHAAYVTNPNGSHLVTITAGIGTAHADALEMLPADVRVAPGDTVRWVTDASTDEIHTLTFPIGAASDPLSPFQAPVCETGSPPDSAPTAPPPTFCTNPADAEFPIDPAPHGGTTLATPATVATSGLIAFGGGPLPDSYSFTFSGAGNFTYQCKVHEFMRGAIHSQASPGYWNVAADGGVFTHGAVPFDGSQGGKPLNMPIVGAADTPDPGYWMAASDGGVFSFGDAQFFGSMGGKPLNKPVVGISGTPSGNGYRLVASDGGIFDFGDAGFFGSTGGMKLNKPIVGMATTPSGNGYWLVAADGGVFTFGDAGFFGSQGGKPLVSPVVGIASTPSGNGYWLVAADGGVFTFGDAGFFGSQGGKPLNKPVVGMASDLGGDGYWLLASDGGVFTFGKAPFLGSEGGAALNKPMVAIASV